MDKVFYGTVPKPELKPKNGGWELTVDMNQVATEFEKYVHDNIIGDTFDELLENQAVREALHAHGWYYVGDPDEQ